MRLNGLGCLLASHATIELLPPELLVIIFTLVHAETYGIFSQSWRNDPLSPTTFPYALASVCNLWQDVMSTVPQFWTRIVVFIDSNSFSLSNLPSHLEWSQDLPFQITVVNRSCSDAIHIDNGEKARVRQAIDALGPHLQRCSSLQFDLAYTSSLPSIYADIFHGRVFPNLRSIIFEARVGDGPGSSFRHDLSSNIWCEENPLPELRCLVLDGFNYVDLCEHHADWFLSMTEDEGRLKEASISHFKQSQRDEQHKFSFYDGCIYLKDVAYLKLSSLDFTWDLNDPDADNLEFSELRVLMLEDLSWQLAREVLSRCEFVSVVSIVRCAIGEISDVTLFAYSLILEDIPASPNFPQFLAQWEGFHLTIRDCPSFDDRALENCIMAPDSLYSPVVLGNLTIHNCPNFSVKRLKHLIGVQIEQCHRLDRPEVGCLVYLKVTGRGPFLSDEDRKWFTNNVESFGGWDTHQNVF